MLLCKRNQTALLHSTANAIPECTSAHDDVKVDNNKTQSSSSSVEGC